MRFFLLFCLSLFILPAQAKDRSADPHYTEAGFFDIHVCNWPVRPQFFLSLFSTTRYDELAQIQILAPSGKQVSTIDLARYRLVKQNDGVEKRVFMSLFDVPPEREEGWYKALIHLKNGRIIEARDRIELKSLPIASGLQPAPDAVDVPLPSELRWKVVPGALYYQVFIKDVWDDGKLILTSKLLTEPRLPLPAGLIKPGGSYLWQIHARHLDDDPVWGDFNHGSLTSEVKFSVAD